MASKISGVILESDTEEVDLISDLANDSSQLLVIESMHDNIKSID